MNILSFDVGIKNLAYCLVNVTDATSKKFNIIDWGVINLMATANKTDDASHKCMTCTKKASLQTIANDRHYCVIHAKKDAHFKPIDNKFKDFAVVHSLDKIPMKRLNEFIAHYSIIIASKKPLKGELLEIVKKFISDYCFVKCGSGEKKKKANDFDLVRLGVALRDKLDATFSAEIRETIDKIVIENQIGPLAIRMKSLQGMITQYFIMKELTDISYISASNKLKMFEGSELMYEVDSEEEKNDKDNDKESKKKYKERKDKSVEIVAKLVDRMPIWEKVFKTHAKKDDLADSLLQALWYAS